MFYILYKITNNINQKIYIGIHKTCNINDHYMGSGKLIKQSIKKYGKENFHKDLLFVFNTLEEAQLKEREIVDSNFILREDNYNISIGGGLGGADINGLTFYNRKHTDETKEKIRCSRIGKSFLTNEGKAKLINNNINNQLRKEKISNTLKGKPSNNKKGINGTNTGKIKKGITYKSYKRKYKQIWITNEIKNTRIREYDLIPDGWRKGRISSSGIV